MFNHTSPEYDAVFRADQEQYLALRPATLRGPATSSPLATRIGGDSPLAALRPLSDPCHRTGIPSPASSVSSVSSALTDAVLAATGLPFMRPSPVPVRPASLVSPNESLKGDSFEEDEFHEPTDEPLPAFEALKAEYEAYFSSEGESSRSSSRGSSRPASSVGTAADVDEPLPAFLALKAEYESYFASASDSSRSWSPVGAAATTTSSPAGADADCPALAGVCERYATHSSRLSQPSRDSRWFAPSSCGCPPSSSLSLTSEDGADFDFSDDFEPIDAVEAFSDSDEPSGCGYLSSFSSFSVTSTDESVDSDAGSICSDAELLSVLSRDADWDDGDEEEEDCVPQSPESSAKDARALANWEAGSLCSDAELLSVLSRDADWSDDEEKEDCVLQTPASAKEERELAFLRRALPVCLLQRALPLHSGDCTPRQLVANAILKAKPTHFPAPPTTSSRAALAGRFVSEMSALLDKYSALVK